MKENWQKQIGKFYVYFTEMFIKHFRKKLIDLSNKENMVISGRQEVVITRNKHRESWDARNVSSLD